LIALKRQEALLVSPVPVGERASLRADDVMIIARHDIPKFAVNKRDAGTPEENKAVLAGMLGFFGTFSVNSADQVLVSQNSIPLVTKSRLATIVHDLWNDKCGWPRFPDPSRAFGAGNVRH
jgi:hypothetical protein